MFTQQELMNIVMLIEEAFKSGGLKTSQDAAVAITLQQKCRGLIEEIAAEASEGEEKVG